MWPNVSPPGCATSRSESVALLNPHYRHLSELSSVDKTNKKWLPFAVPGRFVRMHFRSRERNDHTMNVSFPGTKLPSNICCHDLSSPTTVAFCRTLAVAHCGPIPMTCGSCLCHEHITNSMIGVSRPPVLDCGMTFHLNFGSRDLPTTLSDNLWKVIYLATEASSDFWIYRRYINKSIYPSIYLPLVLHSEVAIGRPILRQKTFKARTFRAANYNSAYLL